MARFYFPIDNAKRHYEMPLFLLSLNIKIKNCRITKSKLEVGFGCVYHILHFIIIKN